MRGRCRRRAQRPLPSMMMAMWRGRRVASSFAKRSASLRSSPSGMCVATAISEKNSPFSIPTASGPRGASIGAGKEKGPLARAAPRLNNQLLRGNFPHTATVGRNADEAAIGRHVDVRNLDHRQAEGGVANKACAGIMGDIKAQEVSDIDRVLVARIHLHAIDRHLRKPVVGRERSAANVGERKTAVSRLRQV